METTKQAILINPNDNVVVAIVGLAAGSRLQIAGRELVLAGDIPAGHKIALTGIRSGQTIIKYGYPIGKALADIPAGSHVHIHNLGTLLGGEQEYDWNPVAPEKTMPVVEDGYSDPSAGHSNTADWLPIRAYRRADGGVGIRNEIWIIPTVGCVNRTAESLAAWADKTFAGPTAEGGSIDGVQAWSHPYGCSQMGEDHAKTRKVLAALARHPNAAAVLVLGLGCENNTIEGFKQELGDYDPERIRFLVTQLVGDEIETGRAILAELAALAGRFRRETVPASALVLGMKCGGSDGFSGLTANPLIGRVSDSLTALGGTVLLTEVPEMFGAEQLLMDRCADRAVFEKTVRMINGFKHYYTSHNQVVYENPSPGNKDGGISTLEDKSLGCVQKGGQAVVQGVLGYGERCQSGGLQLLDGPGNDIVSTTALAAAGAHIILFSTGRGTPLGAPVPTLKISSNSQLAARKGGWIDFDAGRLLGEPADYVLKNLLRLIQATASGEYRTRNEQNGYREIAIFKDGVTL